MIAMMPELSTPVRTVEDLLHDLGGIAPHRIRLQPPPGLATVADVVLHKLCELVDATLVEKAMGLKESFLAAFLIRILGNFVVAHDLGKVAAPDGTFRLMPGLVRLPDVAFISWSRFPNRQLPREPVPNLAPDLAIEVLSEGNTAAEMLRKRREYFQAGVRQVWMVDRFTWTVSVYSSESACHVLTDADSLDGGSLLPGFTLPVRELFAEIRQEEAC